MKKRVLSRLITIIYFGMSWNWATAQPLSLAVTKPTAPKWAWHQPIYEVDIERATPEGTFRAFAKQLPRLQQLGVGIIWLMPIHQRGKFRVATELIDSLGGAPLPVPERYRQYDKPTGPYNVHDHYSVNPAYGTPEDLKALIRQAHKLGIYVILDWVINHTSWDHVLTTTHPDFYARKDNGIVAYTAPWKDIVQLDYTNRNLWKYMTDMTAHWLREYDLDGFRTDVADRVPPAFWAQLRTELDSIKPVFLLAEGFKPELHPAHDCSYDWFLSPAFWSVKEGKRSVAALDTLLAREQRQYPTGFLRMRHATNHDIQAMGFANASRVRYYDPVFDEAYFRRTPLSDKFGDGLKAYMVLCATLPNSVPMIWNGQEMGILARTPKPIPWQTNAWTDFYTRLFALYRTNEALLQGNFQRISSSETHPELFAFARTSGASSVVVIVNCGTKPQQFSLDSPLITGKGTDVFSGESVVHSARETLTLPPWGFRVITYRR